MIPPTVGRVVWYVPGTTDTITRFSSEPLAAIIAAVEKDHKSVNLTVFDATGGAQSREGVILVQPEETYPTGDSYARWPDSVIKAASGMQPK